MTLLDGSLTFGSLFQSLFDGTWDIRVNHRQPLYQLEIATLFVELASTRLLTTLATLLLGERHRPAEGAIQHVNLTLQAHALSTRVLADPLVQIM